MAFTAFLISVSRSPPSIASCNLEYVDFAANERMISADLARIACLTDVWHLLSVIMSGFILTKKPSVVTTSTTSSILPLYLLI